MDHLQFLAYVISILNHRFPSFNVIILQINLRQIYVVQEVYQLIGTLPKDLVLFRVSSCSSVPHVNETLVPLMEALGLVDTEDPVVSNLEVVNKEDLLEILSFNLEVVEPASEVPFVLHH